MVFLKRLMTIFLIVLSLAGCGHYFFYPLEQHLRTPTDIGLEYRDIFFSAEDGTELHGWLLLAKGQARANITFFHGNAENISTHIGSVYWLPEQGYNVFLPDYRGYGKSAGKPDFEGIHLDAAKALEVSLLQAENKDLPLIVLGQSLGGAVAIYSVAHSVHKERINAVVVEGAFSSYHDIAKEKLAQFWVTWPLQWSVSWTISDHYSPAAAIDKIAPIPLLLIYGEHDSIIPIDHGRKLFERAGEPKAFWQVANGRHTNTFSRPDYRQKLLTYFETIIP